MKNKYLQSVIFPVLLFVAFAGTAATTDNAPDSAEKRPDQVKNQAPDEPKKKYEPAGRFIPTEKLRADDVVPFPVDI